MTTIIISVRPHGGKRQNPTPHPPPSPPPLSLPNSLLQLWRKSPESWWSIYNASLISVSYRGGKKDIRKLKIQLPRHINYSGRNHRPRSTAFTRISGRDEGRNELLTLFGLQRVARLCKNAAGCWRHKMKLGCSCSWLQAEEHICVAAPSSCS